MIEKVMLRIQLTILGIVMVTGRLQAHPIAAVTAPGSKGGEEKWN